MLGLDPLVGRRHLLRFCELRAQRVQQHPGGHAPDGELAGAIEKSPPVDAAVHVLIKEIEELLIEVFRRLSFHEYLRMVGRPSRGRLGLH